MTEPILTREEVLALMYACDIPPECEPALMDFAERYEAAVLEKVCGEPVAWRDPKNVDPGQSVTFDAQTANRWSHLYSQPLFALTRSKP